MYSKAVIAPPGMGGFINPPGHPEHTHHVAVICEATTSMSLSSALKDQTLSPNLRGRVQALLLEWASHKLSLTHPDVIAWTRQVLGYFRNCYRNPGAPKEQQWHADKLIIDKRDPLANADEHAGVHFIRKYYPDYTPTAEDFANARWGN